MENPKFTEYGKACLQAQVIPSPSNQFGSTPTDEQLALLLAALKNGSWLERSQVLEQLTPELAEHLKERLKALTDDHSPIVRASALRALHRCGASELGPIIREALHDSDKLVRKAASEIFHGSRAWSELKV